MRINPEIQSLWDAGDWLGLLGWYALHFWQLIAQSIHVPSPPVPDQLLPIAWLVAYAVLLAVFAQRLFCRPRIPWRLGRVTVDLCGGRDTLHGVVAGMSGTGKSSAVLPLLMLDKPVLVVAFDNSRPIRELFEAMGWTIWTPGGSLGWDILNGPPQIVSEALTSGFDKTEGDTGYNSGLAGVRIWRALEQMDASNTPRDIWLVIAALKVKSGNGDEDRACQTWANRLEILAMSLGPSLGRDLDLGDCLKRGEKVLILPNRFVSPRVAPLVGGIALVQARRFAQEVGDFLLIVEEAGQAGRRMAEMVPLSQAARDRGVPLVVLTQNMAKLPEEVINNTSVWVSFAQESKKETLFACERMRDVPDPAVDFDRDVLPTGWCWVRAPGVRPRRVKLGLIRPKTQRGDLSVADTLGEREADSRNGHGKRIEIIELERESLPALPAPGKLESELLANIYRQGECERWRGKHDRAGHKKDCRKDCRDQEHIDGCYGLVWWPLAEPTESRTHDWQRVHRVRWRLTFGPIPIDPETGTPMTIDHRRECYKDCSRIDHVEPCSRGENSKRRWRVRGVGTAV